MPAHALVQDVTSVRALLDTGRICCRGYDEYETECVLSRRSSKRPLSLRELIDFIDSISHPSDAVGQPHRVPFRAR
jgi:hypothetical protein